MTPISIRFLLVAWTAACNLAVMHAYSQESEVTGLVHGDGEPLPYATVYFKDTQIGTHTDIDGKFRLVGTVEKQPILVVSAVGYRRVEIPLDFSVESTTHVEVELEKVASHLSEFVVTGTMREVSKADSPVPVEVYSAKYFRSNPTPSVFEAVQQINGVRPQINCSICNTGDIHINGLEGPYTMVLIDGMPIVSGLSTVYSMSGIPRSLIERVEVVKGPAAALYGSEAIGGIINVITVDPDKAPALSADVFGSSWGEINADVAAGFRTGRTSRAFLGVNHFNYSFPKDVNGDGFTDVALQNRISVFNKWQFRREGERQLSVAVRFVSEDRKGGEMEGVKPGADTERYYVEDIRTRRWEIFGAYDLPTREDLVFRFSANGHDQNSLYGDRTFLADQFVAFGQMTWTKTLGKHNLLVGTTIRYTYYDDDTPATARFETGSATNEVSHTYLPGIFLQDEFVIDGRNTLLAGVRYDYNTVHGDIFTPRINFRHRSVDGTAVFRLGAGSGYRVVHVFTEDHAALTGARELIFTEDLKPETSWNANANFVKRFHLESGANLGLDASIFYTRFGNKIVPDYESDPTKIIYGNLDGYGVSQGLSLSVDGRWPNGLHVNAGATWMDVFNVEDGVKRREVFAEKFSAVWNVGYSFDRIGLSVDYTGNVYSPMRLPLAGEMDPRPGTSPWWSIQNVQLTKRLKGGWEVYAGVKNLLDFTPGKGLPFLIARAHDPFDWSVKYGSEGQVVRTPENPYALTFDPEYIYAPNQGIRGFLGVRFTLEQ